MTEATEATEAIFSIKIFDGLNKAGNMKSASDTSDASVDAIIQRAGDAKFPYVG